MSHQTRMPSVKVTLDKELFNQLIRILDYNMKLNVDAENFSIIASKLKEKLLKYCVPRTNEDNIEFIDARFFPSEAGDMIWQLLLHAEKNDNNEDYYSQLLDKRLKDVEK